VAPDGPTDVSRTSTDENILFIGRLPDPGAERLVSEALRTWKAAGSESDRGRIEKKLREVLKGQFQARLAAHQKEIEQLEAKVKQLREQLELRRTKQDEIVDFRLQQLLREAQGLGWGTEPAMGLPPLGLRGGRASDTDPFDAKPFGAPARQSAAKPAAAADQAGDPFDAPAVEPAYKPAAPTR
jgi:polyhydroxyalkanoate synthesis regulator phasin